MKAKIFFLLVSFTSGLLYAQNVNFQWVKQMGGIGAAGDGRSIAVDALGNVYTAGEFFGTVDFDPGPAVFNLSSVFGSYDIYVTKSDAAGNFIWAKQMGGNDYDVSFSIALDAAGNIYTTGFFEGTADFDPGPGVFNLATIGDGIFISKLDAAGNFVWAKQMASANPLINDRSLSIAIDASGNVYTTGSFGGTVDFDPGPGVFNLSTASNTGDIFISKLDAAGNFVWAKQFQGVGPTFGDNMGCSIAVDASGNIYVTGQFFNIVDFDPGPGVFNLSTGSTTSGDIFVSKLDAAGNFLWAKQMHGVGYTSGSNTGISIVLDASGYVYCTGILQGTVDFDPGPAIFNLSSTGSIDIFILKLDIAGNFIWAKQMGGVGDDEGLSISLDAYGNIYTTGYFQGTVDFDPGTGTYNLTSIGSSDIFISKLNGAGNFVWANQLGGTGADGAGYSIAVDATGNILTTGNFRDTYDFDPGSGVFNLVALGISDIFVHKMSQCTNTSASTITASACNTYTLNGQTYNASGVYTQSLINAVGCDSIITLNLTINSRHTTLNATACVSYLWNGQTYNSSGTYIDTLIAANGCDSIVTLNLVIRPRSSSTINAAICPGQNYSGHTIAGTYTDTLVAANGCDSVRTINLTVSSKSFSTINAAICTGQNYSGHSTPGTYTDTLVAANGCDSIRTIYLSVKAGSYATIDTAICPGQNYSGHTSAGTYADILIAANGCDSVRTTHLTIKYNCNPIGIPNAFTPNGDTKNDVFKPTINEAVYQYSFIIYNRYGQLIFETSDYARGWNGTYKGKEQPTGSYVYRILFTNIYGYTSENIGTVLLLK